MRGRISLGLLAVLAGGASAWLASLAPVPPAAGPPSLAVQAAPSAQLRRDARFRPSRRPGDVAMAPIGAPRAGGPARKDYQMRSFLPLLAAVAMAAPAAALAQDAPAPAPTDAAAPAATAGAETVSAGQSVKDNTGVVIGQVAEVKPDAAGKTTATIKMGADVFAVDTAALAVEDGAAVINATQAEIQAMLKK